MASKYFGLKMSLFFCLYFTEIFLRADASQTITLRNRNLCSGVLSQINKKLTELGKKVDALSSKTTTCSVGVPKNCVEVLECGYKKSGVYKINPDGKGAFDVFCDQITAGGGWTVFQKRRDGSVNFNRGWDEYKYGFGHLNGEHWLGLEKINRLTHATRNKLRVDLEDTKGKVAYAQYGYFAVASENVKYRMSLGLYSGTAGDSLSNNRESAFSTKDRDNDRSSSHCARSYKSGWWFKDCHLSNLNGLYLHGAHRDFAAGVTWYHWKGYNYSAKRAEMKLRPVGFIPT